MPRKVSSRLCLHRRSTLFGTQSKRTLDRGLCRGILSSSTAFNSSRNCQKIWSLPGSELNAHTFPRSCQPRNQKTPRSGVDTEFTNVHGFVRGMQPSFPDTEVVLVRSAPANPVLPIRVATPETRLPAGVTSPPERLSTDRPSIARELQQELRRAGCYDGAIDGNWNTSTRRAMKTFTDRVNAALPIAAPDLILVALVKNHPGEVCGDSCPAGQQLATDGRCAPKGVALVAAPAASRTAFKPDAAISTRSSSMTPASGHPAPIEGRMSVGIPPAQPPSDRAHLAAVPSPATKNFRQPGKARQAGRQRGRRLAYLRPLRPMRYAYRPFRSRAAWPACSSGGGDPEARIQLSYGGPSNAIAPASDPPP